MLYRISLISSDGIGPEITQATREVLEATGAKIIWEEVLGGTASTSEFALAVAKAVRA